MSYLCNRILSIVFPCWFKSKTKDFSHFGDQQNFQRQTFMNQQFEQSDYSIQHQKSLTSVSTNDKTNYYPQQSSLSTTQYKQTHQSHLGSNQQKKQYDSSNSQKTKIQDYSDVITSQNSYYAILLPKIQKLTTLFQVDQKYRLNCPQTSYPLKMYCRQSEDNKTNIFIYFFQFPGNYEGYQTLLNDFELQKSFDHNIDEYYKMIQSPNHDTKIIYLSYKKVLIVSPRDFVYVRYVFKKQHQFWSISTSIPHQEETAGKIRGEIHLTATKVEQRNNKIYVSVYSQVDMKMAIKAQMAKNRGMGQIRKYLDKCYKNLSQNKNVSII